MDVEPAVTVVIPTRDRTSFLRSAVTSAVGQVDTSVEIVIVDDGSTEPPEIKLAAPQVTVLRHSEPRGAAAARNTGAHAARADWLAWLDDDDLYAPNRLRLLLDAAHATSADFAYSSAIVVDEHLRPLRVDPAPVAETVTRALRHGNAIPGGGSGVVVKTSLFDACGGFDETLSFAADWDMWIRLAATGKGCAVELPLLAYRVHASSWTMREDPELRRDLRQVADKHRGVEPPSADTIAGRALWWSGRRGRACARFLAAAWHDRDPGAVAYAAGASLSVPVARRIGLVAPRPAAPRWLAAHRRRLSDHEPAG